MKSAVIAQVIDQTAARYVRRCWWVDQDDLRQEAWLEVLSQDLRFLDQATPSRAKGYVYRIVARRMSRYLWRESSPVPCAGHRDKQQSSGKLRAEVPVGLCSNEPTPEARALANEAQKLEPKLRARVRERVAEVATGVMYLDAVLLIVLDGRSVLSVARAKQLNRDRLGSDTLRVKKKIRSDRAIRQLMRELAEARSDAEC